ncbi:hypothetical protein [Micromonospora craniellae]|uniref:ABC transporter ATP-binding protein n=1 Tax=Micromonospora craniellae TaxID=2294034 RepID=A0A372FZV0_9ACTN|nr:hypothetical protein [Micromonospora craniellae]QOC94547.1 hypothetical protein ID554_13875 [Micromonospora craniellae]RFS46337.1 hypothetical protein D0Q02_11155 [Micromonospora craniellae]
MIVIAHRLQTVLNADQIVVLDGRGGIEATGSHADLLSFSPTYQRFWSEKNASLGWRVDVGN